MTQEQRDALQLLYRLNLSQEEFILLASFVVDWHEPAPKLEIANDGYVHAPLGDFLMSVDKEDTDEDEDDDDGHLIDDPMHVMTVKPDFENLGIPPQHPQPDTDKNHLFDPFTKGRPLRVNYEFHMVPECYDEIFKATMHDDFFRSFQFDGKGMSAILAKDCLAIIKNGCGVDYDTAPSGSWVVFGLLYTASSIRAALVLSDEDRERLFKEGRAILVKPEKSAATSSVSNP